MTGRERVQAVLRREAPDRLPKELKLTPGLLGRFREATGNDDPAEYFRVEVRDVYFRPPASQADFSAYYPDGVPPLPNAPGWEVGEWGVGQIPGSEHHFIRIAHPLALLRATAELDSYPWPDLSRPERHEHLEAEVNALHARGLFAIGFMEWTIFELAWHLRGMERFFTDLVEMPAFATALLDRITAARCFQAARYAEAGVDLIKIGDDVGTQRAMLMSPATYREWLKPRHASVIAAARSSRPDVLVSYHSDGDCLAIIPDLIEIGVNVLNPVQPECMDLRAIRREFGRDLVFWGGIGTQTTMPFGSSGQVRADVWDAIETLGPTGYLPCPTHVLEPEVPVENIVAFVEAVESYPISG